MRHRLPPLTALRAFDAAAHRGSFADAARDLCVSHSAISQHIRTLEKWLRVDLFRRLGNRVELTPEGQALKPRLNEAFTMLAEACEEISHIQRDRSLRIIVEPGFATRWLRPRLKAFRDAHPELSVRMYSGSNPVSDSGSTADVVIHFEENLKEQRVRFHRLFPIDTYPACSPEFLAKHPGLTQPSDIAGLPLIHDNSRQTWRRWFSRYLPSSDEWQSGYVYPDLSLAIDSALDGEGLFLADDLLCKHEIANGTLVKALDSVMRSTWYCLAIPQPDSNPRDRQLFTDWLLKSLDLPPESL
ncbi:LysR family transcriptional regulator [Pseudomonas sp. LPB0260]|uniref:LysR substrate-binding domain-containing protein n=1 Tax=Pseudomonas sp. LPB0260 TaxID=2614442 RepID=UPI0015C239DC|nr:LysR substrate-binding domain-containing protein [Pseudomonas sp. LPB0260]QLC74683.1 LysR family transcriptional regulator [Pseudomonas sp. LPB0260]